MSARADLWQLINRYPPLCKCGCHVNTLRFIFSLITISRRIFSLRPQRNAHFISASIQISMLSARCEYSYIRGENSIFVAFDLDIFCHVHSCINKNTCFESIYAASVARLAARSLMTWNRIDRQYRFEFEEKKKKLIQKSLYTTKFNSVFRLIYPIPKTAITKPITFIPFFWFNAIQCDSMWQLSCSDTFDQFNFGMHVGCHELIR